jgi:hypothetical protein
VTLGGTTPRRCFCSAAKPIRCPSTRSPTPHAPQTRPPIIGHRRRGGPDPDPAGRPRWISLSHSHTHSHSRSRAPCPGAGMCGGTHLFRVASVSLCVAPARARACPRAPAPRPSPPPPPEAAPKRPPSRAARRAPLGAAGGAAPVTSARTPDWTSRIGLDWLDWAGTGEAGEAPRLEAPSPHRCMARRRCLGPTETSRRRVPHQAFCKTFVTRWPDAPARPGRRRRPLPRRAAAHPPAGASPVLPSKPSPAHARPQASLPAPARRHAPLPLAVSGTPSKPMGSARLSVAPIPRRTKPPPPHDHATTPSTCHLVRRPAAASAPPPPPRPAAPRHAMHVTAASHRHARNARGATPHTAAALPLGRAAARRATWSAAPAAAHPKLLPPFAAPSEKPALVPRPFSAMFDPKPCLIQNHTALGRDRNPNRPRRPPALAPALTTSSRTRLGAGE